ncbi:MAG: hypothetical protein ACK4K7_06520 [Allosphingosinicella sp.]|uniref:hypothetical protein n=1 Tax=Allosphingosinicella sp. TaxID=2823234 RepID=UPI0039590F6E
MRKMVASLMVLVLLLANGTAIAAAFCRHGGAEAHEQARRSSDPHVAGQAVAGAAWRVF